MIGNKKILVVVTARKGSKGIPGKNFRELLGKPLFIWSVEAALQSKYVDSIVVSSNCPRCKLSYLLCVAKREIDVNDMTKTGRVVWIDRPDELAGDKSKNEDALIHALKNQKEEFEILVNLQPTSPCRLNGLLDRCIEEYYNGYYDSLLTGSKLTPFLWRKVDGEWKYTVDKNDCCNRKMRQDFKDIDEETSELLLHDSGNIYMSDTDMLLETGCRIGEKPCVVETTGINNIQIDEEFDFQLIENMAKTLKLDSLV